MSFPPNNQDLEETPNGGAEAARTPEAAHGSASDAGPGNTASDTCKGEGEERQKPLFEVVWQGVDTLELTYAGQVDSQIDKRLQALKELARSSEGRRQATAQIQLGDRFFEVADKSGGRFFAYLLRHPDMRVVVASGNATRIPLASVTLQNQFLVAAGPEAAEAAARSVVAALGTLDGEERVKRCDLAADIASDQLLDEWTPNAWVTRAERIDPHYVNNRFTGWSIGLGADVSMRLYDKKLEIVKSNKPYFLELWEQGGWYPADPVVRLEFQFRRPALAQFGLRTLNDVLQARPALWSYAVREWTWLGVPSSTDDTRSRWAVHPFWKLAQAISCEGAIANLRRSRPSNNAPSDKQLAKLFKAVVTSFMARQNVRVLDEAVPGLVSLLRGQLQRIEEFEGASGEDLLWEVVMLKRRKYGLEVKR